MRVLITRPEPDATTLAALLIERGHDVTSAPLIEIAFENGDPPDLSSVQALTFTSANGVRAFCRAVAARHLPVYAVGSATAKAATEAGFGKVFIAGGDVTTLTELIRRQARPKDGAMFHAAGSHLAGDLSGLLKAAGFSVLSQQMYAAKKTTALSAELRGVLERRELDAVLFFSPRTAAHFADLVTDQNLTSTLEAMVAVCLSQNVATVINTLQFKDVRVSSEPTQLALLKALEKSAHPS